MVGRLDAQWITSCALAAAVLLSLVFAACTSASTITATPTGDRDDEQAASTTTSEPADVLPFLDETSSLPGPAATFESTVVPTSASVRSLLSFGSGNWSDLSPNGEFLATAGDEGLCVVDLVALVSDCSDSSYAASEVSWARDSSKILIEPPGDQGALRVHSISEAGIVGAAAEIPLDQPEFIAWGGDSGSIVGRVDGFLSTIDLDTGESVRIGEVAAPYDALATADRLWYSAPGEIGVVRADGSAQRFEVDDLYKILATDGTGQIALLASTRPEAQVFLILDAAQQTEVVLAPSTNADAALWGTLSPDGNVVLSFESGSEVDSRSLFSIDIEAARNDVLDWKLLVEEMDVSPIASPVWLSANYLRVLGDRGVDDIVLEG